MQTARPYYYLGGNWALTQLSTGQPFFVNTNDRGIATWIILGGTWENFVDDILMKFAQPGMTIVDVGANLGYYTVKLGMITGPSGRVYAYEPNPELIDFVIRNIDINGFNGRCTLFPAAAGASSGKAELTFPYSNMGGGYLKMANDASQERSANVAVVTLDETLHDVGSVDLMKIDAEGYEPQVLLGARNVIQRSPHCSYLLEISLGAWQRFGHIEDILAPLSQGKAMFSISHSTKLMKVEPRNVQNLLTDTPGGMAYFLICPEQPEIMGRLERFLLA